jgi:uncharacterized protein YoxC
LYIALAISALIFAIGVTVAMMGIRNSVAQVTQRLDETLRQVEMTTEDLRKTNNAVRGVVSSVDYAVANVAHFTDGIRGLRQPVDVAAKVFDRTVSPALIGFAGGLAGIKAAASYIVHRISGNSGKEAGR